MHMTEKCMTATVCPWTQPSFLMVMSHGAEAHSTAYTVAFRYFRKKLEQHESTLTTLKHTQVDSSTEQNLSYNFETQHHATAVKSPTRQQW